MLSFQNTFNKYKKRHPLAYKLLFYILLCSSVITILSTGFQLFMDYRNDVSQIDQRLKQIEDSYVNSLANGLWDLNRKQIELLLAGITHSPGC